MVDCADRRNGVRTTLFDDASKAWVACRGFRRLLKEVGGNNPTTAAQPASTSGSEGMCLQKTMIVLQLMGMFRVCHRYFTCSFPRRNSPVCLLFLRVPFSGKTVYFWKMNSRTRVVLFACNEVAFTVLDVVEQQLRLNKIDAARDTMGTIADATVWSSAMEAIAISQFKAGDQRGALHTANLIPHDINRNGALMHIAFAQARLGHVEGAIKTATHITAPLRRDAVLLGVVLIRAEGHDVPGALAAANRMGSESARLRAYREVAHREIARI